MTYKAGDLVKGFGSTHGTAVWSEDLAEGLDVIEENECAIVTMTPQYAYGWVKVITPRGIIGTIHSSNLSKT